jgi:hypothetical protein
VGELKITRGLLIFIIAVVVWECYPRVVVVIVVVTTIVGDVVNVGEVGGAGISADVTGVTI